MTNDRDDEVVRLLAKIDQSLQEIKSSLKLYMRANRKELYETLSKTLDTPSKKIVYHLTDGERSAREISQMVGISMPTIHRWWSYWERMGLVSRIRENGRQITKKNLLLEEIGFEVPSINELRGEQIEHASGEIPDKEKLKAILRNSAMFKSVLDLINFSEKVFEAKISGSTCDDVIESITQQFYTSPKMKQMLFLQALRQQATTTGNDFKEYFEFWEKQIKSEL